jgi:hypothetical protein
MFFVENERGRPNDQFTDLGSCLGQKSRKKTQAPATTHAAAGTRPSFRAGGNLFKSFKTVTNREKSRMKA